MSNTQADVVPNDANATPISQVIPASHGEVASILLTLPSGVATSLSVLAGTAYPTATATKGAPDITGWLLSNETANVIRVGGHNITAVIGFPLPSGLAFPQSVGWQTDPAKTYIRQDSGAPITLNLTLLGKLTD